MATQPKSKKPAAQEAAPKSETPDVTPDVSTPVKKVGKRELLGLKSFKVTCTMYDKDGHRMLQFTPDGTGDSAYAVMDRACDMFIGATATDVSTVNRVDMAYANGIKVRVAWRRSGDQCLTCGSNHTSPRKDCDDLDGCMHFIATPKTAQKHGKLDEAKHLAALQAKLLKK